MMGNIIMVRRYPLLLLLAACIISRVVTTIYYIEDIDCLRFALSVSNYDITEMRPHFPGYPVYCFLLKMLYHITGGMAVSFSILGGIAIFGIIVSGISLVKLLVPDVKSWPLGLLLFFNSQLWVMGNSYMPDIVGLSVLMCCLYLFCMAYLNGGLWLYGFQIFFGLLLGIRLSYAPMLLVPCCVLLWKYRGQAWKLSVVFATTVMLWLLPMVMITGWHELVMAAQIQAAGHFTRWGGSVISSKAGWGQRVVSLIKSAWADGICGWWPGRGWLYVALTVLMLPLLLVGIIALLQWMKRHFRNERGMLAVYLSISAVVYLAWAFFGQNIVHKPRHIMPMVPVLCMLVVIGWNLIPDVKISVLNIRYLLGFLLAISYAGATAIAIDHHFQPTALSQMKDELLRHDHEKAIFVSPAVMGYYMQKCYWNKGQTIDLASAADTAMVKADYANGFQIFSTLALDTVLGSHPKKTTDYYHNPFVNRMWAHLTLYEYQR